MFTILGYICLNTPGLRYTNVFNSVNTCIVCLFHMEFVIVTLTCLCKLLQKNRLVKDTRRFTVGVEKCVWFKLSVFKLPDVFFLGLFCCETVSGLYVRYQDDVTSSSDFRIGDVISMFVVQEWYGVVVISEISMIQCILYVINRWSVTSHQPDSYNRDIKCVHFVV